MANGKEPKTTGEHIVALYGHITGIKRDLRHLTEESCNNHSKMDKRVEKLTWCIIGGLGSIIILLLTFFFKFIK